MNIHKVVPCLALGLLALSSLQKPAPAREQASVLAVEPPPSPPVALRRLFALDFDGPEPFRAAESAGDPLPDLQQGVQLVDGLHGKGALLQEHAILRYKSAGNLDKAAGSIAFWFKPVVDLSLDSGACFFKEDAPLGPQPTNNIWLWIEQGRIRYDLTVTKNDRQYASLGEGWVNSWHHIVITWDCTRGNDIFVDGVESPKFSGDVPLGENQFTWTPQQHADFFIGSRGADTWHTTEPRWGPCNCVLDDFAIYNRPLTEGEVEALYVRELGRADVPPLVLLQNQAGSAGKPYQPILDLKNRFDFPLQGKVSVSLASSPTPLIERELKLVPSATTSLTASPLSLPPGSYQLLVDYRGRRIAQQAFTILRPLNVSPAAGAPVLIGQYNALALRQQGDNYRESAPATEQTLNGVSYLEAGSAKYSRIAFRFTIAHPGQPHLLKLYYPDDKERVFDAIVNSPAYPTTYDTQGGVLTGRELENSGKLQSYELLYWPRETNQALTLMTWADGMPAAIERFEVYELPSPLPAALAQAAPANSRQLGLYWEDPMISQCFGGRPSERDPQRFESDTLDRMVEQMRWDGMNTLTYPIFFYEGPNFPLLCENLVTDSGHDRHPNGYVDMLLQRFEEQKFHFIGEMNFCTSASILAPIEKYRNDLEEGYLAVSSQGTVSVGVQPRLNPLHPLYQQRFAALVAETCHRFAHSSAFQGIELHLVYESPFWLGDATWGYDGRTIAAFEQDTGIQLPAFTQGNIYQQRCDWLMRLHKEQWLDWRCARITQFYTHLAKIVSDTRGDLKLVLGLRYMSEYDSRLDRWKQAGRSMKEIYREAGIDVAQLSHVKNIEFQKYFYPADIKLARADEKGNAMYAGLELRRSAELRDTLTLSGSQTVSTNLYNAYFESPIEAKQPIPNLWWPGPQWRVSGPTPGGRNFLELYAQSLAEFDSPMITTGGFVFGAMGNDAKVAEFARAYRMLPAVRFETVPGTSDTAVVRRAPGYLYVVSSSPFPVTVRLANARSVKLNDLSTGVELSGNEIAIALEPYALRSFRTDGDGESLAIAGYDLPAARRDSILATAALLRGKGPAGAAIAARLEEQCQKLNYVQCKYILEEPATLDLLGW